MSQTLTNTIPLDTIRPVTGENASVDEYGHSRIIGEGFSLRSEEGSNAISKTRTVAIIAILTGTTLVSSFSTGLLTVCLPRMARDLSLPTNLLLWPASVYALTSGCLLILAGSIADVVGSRTMFLIGCFLQAVFVLACGLAKTGIQLIMFRAMQGIALAFCLPTAVSIINNTFPNGRRRTLGLAFLGAGQALGFCVGLVLGGVFTDTIGWRSGYYVCAAVNASFLGISFWGIPNDAQNSRPSWMRLRNEIDWIGAGLASTCLGMLSYVLATVTASASNLKDGPSIALLVISLAIIPAFVFWVGRQERLGKPALIPNSLWKNTAFTSICLMLMLSWSVVNVLEFFASLFFQEVQHLSPLQTSLRFLPSVVTGAILNVSTGLFAHKVRADYLVIASTLLSGAAPLLMALINPTWPYWYSAFWAMLVSPLSCDVLFTVSALVVTSAFPDDTQALGGAVFQTLAQFGTSLGLAVMASISSSVTEHSDFASKTSPQALMEGYRVTFWVSFGWVILACAIGGIGLRKVGKVGLKRE